MNKIIFTGGGTAGHVVPNMVLISELSKEGWDINYIGSENGMERELIEKMGTPYHAIATGKLRRYFDVKNFTDPFKVIKGVFEAVGVIRKIKPDILFSKGGFVSVPAVLAGWLNGVPVIIHESDMTPGLANKISMAFSKKVCVNFPETLSYIGKNKAVLTGTPMREELFKGSKLKGFEICEFNKEKPVLLLIGGSQGSKKLNSILRDGINELLEKFQIVHLCGKGNIDKELSSINSYKQFEYLTDELTHIFAITDIVVSRAGANTIYELLQLQKPNILIPLSAKSSRGDQILNAKSFQKQGFSIVLDEDEITTKDFVNKIYELYDNREIYINNMKKSTLKDGKDAIISLIKQESKKSS
ncbi:MAG TPA: undecaprenyldiphospho-muramoylpentapeptide beta-N-acetylglucosaminyltransferase [Clostridiales bacterium]|nr:MAG: undecaprenyldiphospho-muramoylpentapeptide beta-N-acetylglucosaminyltransferase [Clostridiales bacterium GWD2_32_19]HCC06889.1 undecaprenyldiphospho-muramoylpentapeptide beta-N-acetylglucosaminyltransferase [Clostridiales bacterium]